MRKKLFHSLVTAAFAAALPVGAAAVINLSAIGDSHAAGGGGGGGSFGGYSSSRSSRKDPAPYYRAGVDAYNAGNFEEAERNFDEVLDIVSRDAKANYYMGLTQMELGDYKDAARHLKRARRADDDLYEAYAQLGIAYLKLGERKDAEDELEDLRDALEDCRKDDCYTFQIEKIEEAYNMLNAALNGGGADAEPEAGAMLTPEHDGGLAAARYRTAVGHIEAGDYALAVSQLRQLAAVVGPDADILNYLGFAHRMLGRFDDALHYYQNALAIDPDHRGANEYLGELYVQMGRLDKAAAQLAKLDLLCPAGCEERTALDQLILAARRD